MEIAEIEVRDFQYELEDVGTRNGNWVYDPGHTAEPPGFVLTVRTTDGAEGHARAPLFAGPMRAQIGMVAESLIGRDPLAREAIWEDLWRRLRHTDHLGVGPIDVALWDLAGKHYGASVAELLGGTPDPLPTYASTLFVDDVEDGLSSPEAFADYARECLERGYGGFKFHGHPTGDPDADIAVSQALADEVGDAMDLMLDAGSLYPTYADALRVGRAMDDLGFFWYEDPMMDTGQSAHLATKLVRDLDTPVLGLEHVRTGAFGSADHLAADALDFVRASAHLDGGITGVRRIAETTAAFGADVELLLGGPAHRHCMAALRNTNYFEHGIVHPETEWLNHQGFVDLPDLDRDGRMPVPAGPGLGVEIDWSFVERRATGRDSWE
ncbi:MAG: enolase C-terminal domain-like protein [Haloarculaceae archaeon]